MAFILRRGGLGVLLAVCVLLIGLAACETIQTEPVAQATQSDTVAGSADENSTTAAAAKPSEDEPAGSTGYMTVEEIRQYVIGRCFKGTDYRWQECYDPKGTIRGKYERWDSNGYWSLKSDPKGAIMTFDYIGGAPTVSRRLKRIDDQTVQFFKVHGGPPSDTGKLIK